MTYDSDGVMKGYFFKKNGSDGIMVTYGKLWVSFMSTDGDKTGGLYFNKDYADQIIEDLKDAIENGIFDNRNFTCLFETDYILHGSNYKKFLSECESHKRLF